MKSKRFWMCALGLVMVFGIAPSATATVHPPNVNPDDFKCAGVTNEFFPLVPGTTWTYSGESEGVSTSNVVEVTSCTRVIERVTTTVVHDTAYENGRKVEETFDYFAIACDKTVWYFGEDSTKFDPVTGLPISTEGSWIAGQNDADAGFIMLANPQVGNRYFQEFVPRVAVDQAKVISLDGSACSPYTGCVDKLLLTKETSQLDPSVVENKFYASGIGLIRSEIIKAGDEHSELVSFTVGPATCPPPPPVP